MSVEAIRRVVGDLLENIVRSYLMNLKFDKVDKENRDLLQFLEERLNLYFKPVGGVRNCDDLEQKLRKLRNERKEELIRILDKFVQEFIEAKKIDREREWIEKPAKKRKRLAEYIA